MNENLFTIGNMYSYKQICEIKGCKYFKGGNAKQKQIKSWYVYENWEKIGAKYQYLGAKSDNEIQEYEIEQTYSELLELFLFAYLGNIKEHKVNLSMPKLAEAMCLKNSNYAYGKYNQNEILALISSDKLIPINDEDITHKSLEKFFDRTELNYSKKIKDVLVKMEKMGLISYRKYLYLGYVEGGKFKSRQATEIEEQALLNINNKILKRFPQREITLPNGDKKIVNADKGNLARKENFILYKTANARFLKYLNLKSKESNPTESIRYDYFYSQYEIILSNEAIKSRVPNKISELKERLNNKTIKSMTKNKNVLSSFIHWFIDVDTDVKIKDLLIEHKKLENNIK